MACLGKKRVHKRAVSYKFQWPTHIPQHEQTKVARLCASCNYVRSMKLWWIRRGDSKIADCHRCFASDLERAVPLGFTFDSTGHLSRKSDGKVEHAESKGHGNHNDSSQAARIEKLQHMNADLLSCMPVGITENVPDSELSERSDLSSSDLNVGEDVATRTSSADIAPMKTPHRITAGFAATTYLPGGKRAFSTLGKVCE